MGTIQTSSDHIVDFNEMVLTGLIKVCPDPCCEAVWHNIPKSYTKCNDCHGRVMLINESTFWSKFSNNWFQYDFQTGELFRPVKINTTKIL